MRLEHGFGTIKNALAPLLDVLNHVAGAVPSLRQPVLARHVATLLVATFLRVYAAGRHHLNHPLDGQGPDVLRAIVEQQRANARAEHRSMRLFLEAVHAEYAMPGSSEAFVHAFRRPARRRAAVPRVRLSLPAAGLRSLLRRRRSRRPRAQHTSSLPSVDWKQRRAAGEARRADAAAAQRAAELAADPGRLLHDGLDMLADTWQPDSGQFVFDAVPARVLIRRTIDELSRREPVAAADCIEAHVRSWLAARPNIPQPLCDAVRGVLRNVIANLRPAANPNDPTALVGVMHGR